jgi:hypothetical protein
MASGTAAVLRLRDRRFNLILALVIVAVVFAGFARTYYLRGYFLTSALTPMVHLHGLIFSCWFLLLITQIALVMNGRTDLHRKLGVVGWFLAGVMIPVGVMTAIHAAKYGTPSAPPNIPRLIFLTVPLGDITVFTVFVVAAFLYRFRSPIHKRLIFLATIGILPPATARLPFAFIQRFGPPAFFGIADLILFVCIAYDWYTSRRLRPVYVWGGIFILLMQPLRLVIGGTAAWMTFAQWLTQ